MVPAVYQSLADEIETELRDRVLSCWFPRCIDEAGGFHQSYARDWTPLPDKTASLVFQARMTWVAATLARRRPDFDPRYGSWAGHGLRSLLERFVDREHGGLYFYLDTPHEKHSYAISFAIFAAAACHLQSGDLHARELALRTFEWWDANAYDARHDGFFDALARDGTPLFASKRRVDLIGVRYGCKSSNTLLHTIEALTELYRATRDERVRDRLERCVARLEALVRAARGRLFVAYTPDWRPVDRTISYGHDIETAFLVLDARDLLGWQGPSDTERLLERSLRTGIDRLHGGIYRGRRHHRLFRQREKLDWAHAETLQTTSFMHERTGAGDSRYLDVFHDVWAFVRSHFSDPEHGGWFGTLDRRGNVVDGRKGHQWTACYHVVRALLNAAETFRRLAAKAGG